METMLGSKGKIHRPGSAAASSQGPAPMEVDSFAAWLGSSVKGKGEGKGGKGHPKGGKNNDRDMTCQTAVNRDMRLQNVGVRRKTVQKAQKMEKETKVQAKAQVKAQAKAQVKAQAKAQAMARHEKEKESRRGTHRPLMRPEKK